MSVNRLRRFGLSLVSIALFSFNALASWSWNGEGSSAGAARAADIAEALTAATASITDDDLRRHAAALSDDTFEGRAAGSRGGRAAAGYLQMQFKNIGLQPAGESGGYFQVFDGNCRNILGKIEGSDPELSKQVVLLSAHYDHVGYGNARNSYGPTGYIHNGADDNASGVATLLEVAEAYAKLDPKPKRTVIFALWDAEETGLNGSKHWLGKPTIPLANLKLVINMDMVGRLRNNKLTMIGTRTGKGLRRLVSLPNREEPLVLDFTWEIKADSDHHPFYLRGIPILMAHTGLHGDYHRPSDDLEKLNVDGMRRIARLLLGVVTTLANEPELPRFREASRRESTWSQQTADVVQAAPPGRLGTVWDRQDHSAPGLKIIRVLNGSPAATAGLRVGDRLLRFNDEELTPDSDLAGLVVGAESPATLTIARAGSAEPQTLSVQLRGQPVRLGVTWREDEAEPGTVKLIGIVPSSPAARAGLRPLDRIHEVNGVPITSGEHLRQLIAAATLPYSLSVESSGQMRDAVIDKLKPTATQ